MTDTQELRKLAEAATPGPWAFGTFHRLLVVPFWKGVPDKRNPIADFGLGEISWTGDKQAHYNAVFVASANPTTIIALLDALEAAQAEIERLTAELGDLPEAQADMLHTIKELRERLAELEKQEPVAVVTAVSPIDFIARVTNEHATVLCIGYNVYAAAGASPVQQSQGLQSVADALTIEQLNDKVERLMAVQPSQYGSPELQSLVLAKLMKPSQSVEPEFFAISVPGNQHDTGRVTYKNGGFFARTSSLEDARRIAEALNVQPAQNHIEQYLEMVSTQPAQPYTDTDCKASEERWAKKIDAHPDEFRCPYCLDTPAGKVCVTTDQAGAIVAVTRQDSEGRILEIIAEVVVPSHAHAIDTSPERVEKQAGNVQIPKGYKLVPLEFLQGFNTLEHNYSLRAVPPAFYDGMAGDAFSSAYARCGQDLAKLKAMLSAAPSTKEQSNA